MNLERQLQLTEKALSIDWCIQNLVLIDSIVFARNDSKFVKIFVSDPGHIEILGDFIASRLQAKCNLNPDFEVADKKNIEIVLAQLKFLKEREADKDLNNILRKTESKNQNKSPTTKSRPEALDLNSNNFNRDYRIQLEAKETTGTGEKNPNVVSIDLSNKQMVLGLAASVLMLIGALCPVANLPIVGSISYVANGRGDGVMIIVLSIVSALFAITNKYRLLRFTGTSSLTLMFFTLFRFQFAISEAKESMAGLEGNPFRGLAETVVGSVGLGWGWLLLITGAATILITSFIEVSNNKMYLRTEHLNPLVAKDLKDNITSLAIASLTIGFLAAATYPN